MDFGSEPGEAVNGVWGCEHEWIVQVEATLQEGDEIQCHECWDPIDRAQVRFCTYCGLLACSKCAEGED